MRNILADRERCAERRLLILLPVSHPGSREDTATLLVHMATGKRHARESRERPQDPPTRWLGVLGKFLQPPGPSCAQLQREACCEDSTREGIWATPHSAPRSTYGVTFPISPFSLWANASL